jgi:uncharacterized protein YbaA (DUF1428 family)
MPRFMTTSFRLDPKSMPFDVKRMAYWGFQVLVDA